MRNILSPNPPMRSGLGVRTRGEGRGTRRSALDSDKWGRCDSVGRLGSLAPGSGAVGAVRQAMAGLAIEPWRE